MSIVKFPIMYIPDPTKGRPIFNGRIYIGIPDLDPKIPANQKLVSYVLEDGSLVTADQPIATSSGGVPIYNGQYVTLDTDGSYSLRIDDKFDAQVYYISKVTPDDGSGEDTLEPITESIRLSSGQLIVTSTAIALNTAEIHVSHPSIDSRGLDVADDISDNDYTIVDALTIQLTESFPEGTILKATGLTSSTASITKNSEYPTDAALPKHAMSFDFSFSDEPLQGMQGVDIDMDDELVYISQNVKAGGVNSYDPAEMCQLAVFDYKTDGSTVAANSATNQLDLGHGQDVSLEKVGSTIYLWTSATTPTGASGTVTDYNGDASLLTNVDAGRSIARVEYKGLSTTNSDVTEFQLLPDFDSGDDATWFYRVTPKLSTCGQYIVGKASNMRGRYNPRILVWLKSDIEAGVFLNPVADFLMQAALTNNPDLNTVQSVHLHDDIIYVQLGFTDPLSFKKIVRFSLNGSLLDHYDFYADVSYLAGVETTVEPEGMTFTVADGALRMAMAFNTKTAVENVKSLQIYGTGDPIEHKSEKIGPATIALDDNAFDMSYQEGEALSIGSYNYVTKIFTEVMRLDSSYNPAFIRAVELTMKYGNVFRYLEVDDPGRLALLIRAFDSLTDGSGINLYSKDDPTFPDQIHLKNKRGVFIDDVTSEPPTPVNGCIKYSQAGSYKVKGSSGTVTTLGPA